MSIWQAETTLRSADVDAARRLRLSTLLTMLQEAAIAHTTQLGMGREKTLDRGLLWIITLEQVRIRRLPVYDETVTLLSWPGRTMHLYFPRYFRLTDAGGETLAEASLLWGLMDVSTRSLVFPEEHGIGIEEERSLPALPFPKAPARASLSEAGTFTVPYSYTDLNGHMNNTRYFDLAEDTMPAALRAGRVREIRAEFSAEAGAGAALSLFAAATEGGYCLEGRLDGKKCFRLELGYEG